MLTQFEVSQGEETLNRSRSEGAKAGDNEREERETNRNVDIDVFVYLNPFLLKKSRIFKLVFNPTLSRSPSNP